MSKSKEPPRGDVAQFEAALNELEKIVTQLERGDLRLEESLGLFERGVALTRQCRQSLDSAELRVKHLLGEPAPGTTGDLLDAPPRESDG